MTPVHAAFRQAKEEWAPQPESPLLAAAPGLIRRGNLLRNLSQVQRTICLYDIEAHYAGREDNCEKSQNHGYVNHIKILLALAEVPITLDLTNC